MATGLPRNIMPLFIGNLIDLIQAMLLSPVSDTTADELATLTRVSA